MTNRQLLIRLGEGNIELSCSRPLEELEEWISRLLKYGPINEELFALRVFVLERLRKMHSDLKLGLKKLVK